MATFRDTEATNKNLLEARWLAASNFIADIANKHYRIKQSTGGSVLGRRREWYEMPTTVAGEEAMAAHQDRVLDFIEYLKANPKKSIFLLVASYRYRFRENEFKRSESQKGIAHATTANYKLSTDSMFSWKLRAITETLNSLNLNGLDVALIYHCVLAFQRTKNPTFIPSTRWQQNKLEKIQRYVEISDYQGTALQLNEAIQ
jgi:hypothetical protein